MGEAGDRLGTEGQGGRTKRAALVGYGEGARAQALALRAIGWDVNVVVRAGGMSWVRAVSDGFRPMPTADAVVDADVVVVQLPEAEQPAVWAYGLAPYVAPRSLVVFAHGCALYSGALDPDPRLDVVLVTECESREGGEKTCRVAVHRDATGRALERAAEFARAAFGAPKIGTTTIESEVRADLSELISKAGGLPALVAQWDRVLANPGHEPDEATLTYYERLRAKVLSSERAPTHFPEPPRSSTTIEGSRVSRIQLTRVRAPRKRGAA